MQQETDAEAVYERFCFLLICLHAWLDFLHSQLLALFSIAPGSPLTGAREAFWPVSF